MTTLHPGDVLTIRFPQKNPQGHEQEGYRPAIVVGLPSQAGTPRFDLVMVVPLTTDRGQPWAKISPNVSYRRGMSRLFCAWMRSYVPKIPK
jgi:mRNA interferase MazF